MIYLPLWFVFTYLATVGAAGVALLLLDKKRAHKRGKRISELWLFLLGVAGGALPMYVAMWTAHHKTRYVIFKYGFPVLMLGHAAAMAIVFKYGPTYTFYINIDIAVIVAVLAAINIFAAAVTNWDKKNAKKGMWRVPEAWLMFLGAIGGAFAMLLTMCVIRHKIRYPKFMVGLPIMLVCQVALLIYIFSDLCQFIVIWA